MCCSGQCDSGWGSLVQSEYRVVDGIQALSFTLFCLSLVGIVFRGTVFNRCIGV